MNPSDQKNESLKIIDNFKFVEKLGKGSFGCVYKVIKVNDGKIYACKVENKKLVNLNKKKDTNQRLKGEYLIYKRFARKKMTCVPQIYDYIETPKQNIMCMELLGKSLENVADDAGGKLDLGSVFKIAITILSAIKEIHETGIIHRDIKPNNFMFGINDKCNTLHVMDFGLSKKWYDKGKHIDYKGNRSMIGTPRYASLNIHMGIEPSRRDDIESIGYMLIYLANGSLPWQGLKKRTKSNPIDKIGEKKMMISIATLCDKLPTCFYHYFAHVRNLEFIDTPNYEYLVKIFKNCAEQEHIKIKYYWEQDRQ